MKVLAKLAITDPEFCSAEIVETPLDVEESLIAEETLNDAIVISYFRQKFDKMDKYYKNYGIGVISYVNQE